MKRIFRPGEMLSNTICTNEPGLLESFESLRSKLFKNQIQFFKIVLNNKGLLH